MSSTISGMDALRAEHENALVARQASTAALDAIGDDVDMNATSSARITLLSLPVLTLCLFGVLPFQAGSGGLLYGRFVLGLLACLLLGSMVQAFHANGGVLYAHLATACFAFGGLVGLLCLRLQRIQDLLGPRRMPLELYATTFNFKGAWFLMSRRRLMVVVFLWAIACLSQVVSLTIYRCHSWGAPNFLSLVIFMIALAVMSSLMYCQLHVCCGLELAIDQYCIRFFADTNLSNGISEWNVLQALLRRAASATEACFLAVSTSLLGVLLLTGVELYNLRDNYGPEVLRNSVPCVGLWAGWVLPPTALVFYTVFRAAGITEKCDRVPALVNSWLLTDQPMDHEKQYAVQYIIQSAAGFYVKGVRLNAIWALKISYLFGVLVFTIITQSVLKSG